MPLNLNGDATKGTLAEIAESKPETHVDVTATPEEGGTVRAEVTSEGSYWSASAWYQWAKTGAKSYGAKVGFKF